MGSGKLKKKINKKGFVLSKFNYFDGANYLITVKKCVAKMFYSSLHSPIFKHFNLK